MVPSNLPFLITLAVTLSVLLSLSEAQKLCRPVKVCISRLQRGKPCPLLPVPKKSFQDPLPEEGFSIQTIRPGVFSYNDGAYFSIILYKKRHLVLIDFPESQNSIGRQGEYLLLTAVTKILNGSTPKHIDMVYGHRHLDHIGRAGDVEEYLKKTFPGKKITIWGTSETLEFIRRAEKPRVPEPTVLVGKSGATLDVAAELKLQLKVVGGHTLMDLACHIPPSRDGRGVLHLVDFFSTGSVPFLDFGVTVDFGKYLEAQKKVLKLDWDVISPGHGKLGRRFDLKRNIRYTKSVLKAATDAQAEVDPEKLAEIFRLVSDPSAIQFGNRGWALQEAFQLNVNTCLRKVIRKWGCVLASVDVYGPSHCKEALGFNIVDNQMM